MMWKSNSLHQRQWLGPHKVIIQEGNYTAWCTSNGKLFRSAPENTRRAYPDEGLPEGSELPENMSAIQQLIQKHQNNPNLDEPIIIPDNIPESDNLQPPIANNSNNPPRENTDAGTDSQNESEPQPGQEPDDITPESSQQGILEHPGLENPMETAGEPNGTGSADLS